MTNTDTPSRRKCLCHMSRHRVESLINGHSLTFVAPVFGSLFLSFLCRRPFTHRTFVFVQYSTSILRCGLDEWNVK